MLTFSHEENFIITNSLRLLNCFCSRSVEYCYEEYIASNDGLDLKMKTSQFFSVNQQRWWWLHMGPCVNNLLCAKF